MALVAYFVGVGLGIGVGWSMRSRSASAHLAAGFLVLAGIYRDGRDPTVQEICAAFGAESENLRG